MATLNVREGFVRVTALSPLFFCFAYNVLSRGILKLRQEGKLNYILSPRGTIAPSHCFYADDLIVFCGVDMRGVQNVMSSMRDYGEASRQDVSYGKSNVFFARNITRRQALVDYMEIAEGSLPFRYLVSSIFKGAPRPFILGVSQT